ncbi:MAG: hypothetical protein K8F91_20115 [Candidatus Obscuribacterales bacterium]|nr:hypothetical protein [Candidatus Obscuribacterales bacterium]
MKDSPNSGLESADQPMSEFALATDRLARNPDWALGKTQSSQTGYLGLIAIVSLACLLIVMPMFFETGDNAFWDLRKIFIVMIVFWIMAGFEMFILKVYRRNFDFSSKGYLDRKGVWVRVLALSICLGIVGIIFGFMSFTYPGIMPFYFLSAPLILIFSPFYFMLLQKHGRPSSEPDELLLLGNWLFDLLTGNLSAREDIEILHLKNAFRGLIVKGFFIPIMVISCIHWWKKWEIDAGGAVSAFLQFQANMPVLAECLNLVFMSIIDLFLVIDVTIAMLGYLTSCRILDTQIVSAEPTAFGWFVALICYPPFNLFFETLAWSHMFLAWPESLFVDHPIIATAVSTLIVVLVGIYSWSTVVFGLRFSNLTNRGIITSGPYRIVRHPAYISKNLAWWLALVPCLFLLEPRSLIPALMMILINTIYFFRALTEERHLLSEMHYRQYRRLVRFRFVPGLI